MTDKDNQDDELLALSSIYDEKSFSSSVDQGIPGGYFYASVDLPEGYIIKLGLEGINHHTVVSLPPVLLNFQLPKNYPSEAPPTFTLTSQWLSRAQLTSVCEKLDEFWEENEYCEVLFSWTNFLQNDLLDYLMLNSPLDLNVIFSRRHRSRTYHDPANGTNEEIPQPEHTNNRETEEHKEHADYSSHHDPRAIQDSGDPGHLLAVILEHDQLRRQEIFDGSLFNCDICFVKKLGNLCTQFKDCKHVFCRDCIRSYLEVQIADGNVTELKCPHHECTSLAHPSQVKELVSEELYSKYDRLLLQTSLDKMCDICYCPRIDCMSPVVKDASDTLLGQCPKCYYVFCTLCNAAYHGTRTPCALKTEKLIYLRDTYEAASLEEREFLIKKYGSRAIKQALEETISLVWLGENTKRCPDCGTHIQKNYGCNKMTCLKCRCYFCYLCGVKLHHRKPYAHYNVENGTCFGRLFEGIEDEGMEEDDDDDFDDDAWVRL